MVADESYEGAVVTLAGKRRPAPHESSLHESSLPGRSEPTPRAPHPPALHRVRTAANPLLAAAAPVLDRAMRLAAAEGGPPLALRETLLDALRRFTADAASAGCPPDAIRAGRFALAAMLDDALRATPWGKGLGWLRAGGLSRSVNPNDGGADRFFERLAERLAEPEANRDVLELFYVCLSLGFEGRFRRRRNGGHDLARLRDELYRALRRLNPAPARSLSPTVARAVPAPPRPLLGPAIPARAWIAAVAVVAAGLYLGHAVLLWRQADAVTQRLDALVPEPFGVALGAARPPPETAGPALVARVAAALAPEMALGDVAVLAGGDGALVIRVPGGAMFASDGDQVRARFRAVFDRIGQAVAVEAGHVAVVGHTDDLFAPTPRFATAEALTAARAEAVRALLERRVHPSRLSAEGRGGAEPVAANTTLTGRAANRRIDVRLYPY